MMKLTIRNPERKDWMSGYGVINRALADLDNVGGDPASADVHLFISPPYSFLDVDPTKFNVGLTMSERHSLKTYGFDFINMANKMDLLIVPSTWCKQIFSIAENGITVPTEVVALGHDHELWKGEPRNRPAKTCLILDRGRDHHGAVSVASEYFDEIMHIDCRTPKPTNDRNIDIIKAGRYTQQEIRNFYRRADVFLKWGREGWCFPNLEAMSSGCLVVTNCHHLGYVEADKNCLVFRTIEWLNNHLKRATQESLIDIKKAGQRTAASLTWAKTKEGICDAIARHYRPKVS